jgi:uncharacterized protein YdeI (BOF family)
MVACPACGASLTLRALGQSVTAACPSCGSLIDVSRPDVQLIRRYTEQIRQLRIPLGTRAQLRGQLFQLIGAMERKAQDFSWEEYLLFNPFTGFRWLVFAEGHWSLGRMLRDTSEVQPERGRPYQGHVFRQVDAGPVTVGWVVGEFYWRVSSGESVMATDFAAPPLMLSREQTADEVTWTLLEYLQPGEVEAAFRIQGVARQGVGTQQPNAHWQALRDVFKPAFYALLIAFVLQIIGVMREHLSTFEVGSYDLRHDAASETQVYGPYTLGHGHSAAAVLASAPLDNAWVELQGSLVNTGTGQSYPFDDTVQYYHGVDSDGSWSEGSRDSRVLVSSLPAGTYNLVIDGRSGDQNGQSLDSLVSLRLQLNAVGWRNFWLTACAILAYPLYLLYHGLRFERERWADTH